MCVGSSSHERRWELRLEGGGAKLRLRTAGSAGQLLRATGVLAIRCHSFERDPRLGPGPGTLLIAIQRSDPQSDHHMVLFAFKWTYVHQYLQLDR